MLDDTEHQHEFARYPTSPLRRQSIHLGVMPSEAIDTQEAVFTVKLSDE